MSNYNQNSGYGQALLNMVASQVPTFGRIFIVMDPDDIDEENYQRMQEVFTPVEGVNRFYTSLATAYAATESNNNDVILLDGNSTHMLTGELAVSKNRCHFIGMDSGGRYKGQGTKVQTADGTAAVSVIHVSGTRNTFRNIKFIQGDDEATSLNVLKESGESSLYVNCQFMHGDATRLGGTTTYDILMSGDSTEFYNCTIGQSTLARTVGGVGVAFDTITTASKSTLWKDCIFNVLTSSADYNFIKVISNADMAFEHIFINPIMMAAISSTGSMITVTDAVESVTGLVAGNMLFVNPATNATNFCSTTTDNVKVVGPGMSLDGAAAAVGTTLGIGIVPE